MASLASPLEVRVNARRLARQYGKNIWVI